MTSPSLRIGVMLLILLNGAAGQPLAAQVNVEALRRDPDRRGLSGMLAFDLALRAGNVDLLQLTVNGRADRVSDRSTSFLVGSGDVGLQGGNRFTNAGLVHVRHAYHTRPWLALEGFGQLNYEEPRSLAYRALLGGGIRVRLFDRERIRFSVGSGYMYEHERLDLPATAVHPARSSVHRSSSYASLWAAPATVVLGAIVYIQPQIDDVADTRMLSDISLSLAVTDAIATVTKITLRYDTRPPDGTERVDLALRTGVSVIF